MVNGETEPRPELPLRRELAPVGMVAEAVAEPRAERELIPVEVVGAGVGGAMHFVQIVEVIVLVTVDVVGPVWTSWLPLEVKVCVTGHVVRKVVIISVVTTSCVVPVREAGAEVWLSGELNPEA